MPADEILNRKELAERLSVSERTIARWKKAGLIPTYGPARASRYRWRDVLAAIKKKD